MSATAFQPVTVSGETLFRLVTVRGDVTPLTDRTPRRSADALAVIYGKFANPGAAWVEIFSPAETQLLGLKGDRFMEQVAVGAFDKAVAHAESGQGLTPRLLYAHGSEAEGKRPIGRITRMSPSGHYEGGDER